MIHGRWQFVKHLAKVFDLCVLIASFTFACMVFYPSSGGMTFADFLAIRIKLSNCLLIVLLLFAWHNLFILCGLYVSKRLTGRCAAIFEVCKATLLAAVFLIVLAKIFDRPLITPAFAVIFWVFCTVAMASGRLAAHTFLVALRRRGKNRRFILIVGTNDRAIEFAQQISGRPELGYEIVGFVDDGWSGTPKFEATGHARCSTFSELAQFLRYTVVDEAAIYLPLRSYYEHAAQLVSLCEQHGIVIRFDAQIFNLRASNLHPRKLDEDSQLFAPASSAEP